jgi:hypothetical protein
MGGSVNVQSEIDKGTVFNIKLNVVCRLPIAWSDNGSNTLSY